MAVSISASACLGLWRRRTRGAVRVRVLCWTELHGGRAAILSDTKPSASRATSVEIVEGVYGQFDDPQAMMALWHPEVGHSSGGRPQRQQGSRGVGTSVTRRALLGPKA